MTIAEIALAALGFFAGSIPFSLWVGRLGLKTDIRDYGDGNPGVFNVMRAGGGLTWSGLALMLDISKGAAPVGLAAFVFEITGLPLVIIAVMPPLGHAFSPFLNFQGGKAIAATTGTWIGLTLWEVPLVGAIMLTFWYLVLTSSGWAVMFTMLGILVYLLLTAAETVLFAVWVIIMVLMIYKHRAELTTLPGLRTPPPIAALRKRSKRIGETE